jgi:hypothetical protein
VNENSISVLNCALDYAARGWHVFPVHTARQTESGTRCSCGKVECSHVGKHPWTKHGVKDATTDEATIRKWWQRWPDANIGIATGTPSGFVVLDLDPRSGGDRALGELIQQHGPLPPTVTVETGGSGQHFYFRLDGLEKAKNGEIVKGLDFKTTNGAVVAASSVHSSGKRYAWRDGCDPDQVPIAAAPEWLVELINRNRCSVAPVKSKAVRATTIHFGGTPYGRSALQRECDTLAAAEEGGRNNALNSAAFSIGQLVAGDQVDHHVAVNALGEAALACGLTSAEIASTLKSGMEAGASEPRVPDNKSRAQARPASDDATGTGDPEAAPGREASEEEEEDPQPESQAETLIQLAHHYFRLGIADTGESFVVRRDGANVAIMLEAGTSDVKAVLSKLYRRNYGKPPSTNALGTAVLTLAGEAHDLPRETIAIRVGRAASAVVIDLGTTDGAAVVIENGTWRVEARSPIVFRRTALTMQLPLPDPAGNIQSLRQLLNVTDQTWPLLLGWMVAALIPEIGHPILMFGGQHGSGKTCAAKFVCGVFDPSSAPVRSQPTDPETWAITLAASYAAVIDNVSHIPAWWSDALCKAVTGDGLLRRSLYTNGSVAVLSFRRLVALTSIDAGSLRGDLGDRLVLVDLGEISKDRRLGEHALETAFRQAHPALFGGLLTLAARVMRRLPTTTPGRLPRMADFARVLAAMDACIGTSSFDLFAGQEERIADDVLDADIVGEAIKRFISSRGEWTGTMRELQSELRPDEARRDWPKSPRALGGKVRRLAPSLRVIGIEVTLPVERDKTRVFVFRTTAQTAQQPKTAPADAGSGHQHRAVGGSNGPTAPPHSPASDRSANPQNSDFGLSGCSGGSGPQTPAPTDETEWGQS